MGVSPQLALRRTGRVQPGFAGTPARCNGCRTGRHRLSLPSINLQARGELDEALRIRREEELPVYERLGDLRSLLIARANLAGTLAQRGRPEDRPEILTPLQQALADAGRLRLPEAGAILSGL